MQHLTHPLVSRSRASVKARWFAVLSASVLTCFLSLQASGLELSPDDPHVGYVGRFTEDHRSAWSGSTVRLRFEGDSISAHLSVDAGKPVAFQVIVDGEATDTLIVTPEQQQYTLARDLPAGPHTVELFRRSEASFGPVTFHGFTLPDDAVLLDPPSRPRRLLLIGDSITCGYGNEATDLEQGNTVDNENAYLAFGPVAARRFDADVVMACFSGWGLYRGRSLEQDTQRTLPVVLDRAIPQIPASTYDLRKDRPDVIVINLGTNDLFDAQGEKPALTREQYLGTYRAFIDRLHGLHPQAQIIAAIGPMRIQPIDGWLEELAKEYPFVHDLVFEGYQGRSEEIAGHSHPSVQGHQRMAETLIDTIQQITGW